MNWSLTQIFTLNADWKTTAYFFSGDGVSSYRVLSAVLTQGSSSATITCLGQSVFDVPSSGRVSDIFSLSSFTNGIATFTIIVQRDGNPFIYKSTQPTIGDGLVTATFPTLPSPIGEDNPILFQCDYEGTYEDSINGIIGSPVGEVSLEASSRMFGDGCVKFNPETTIIDGNIGAAGLTRGYNIIVGPGGFSTQLAIGSADGYRTLTFGGSWDNPATNVSGSGDYTVIDAYRGSQITITVDYPNLGTNNTITLNDTDDCEISYNLTSISTECLDGFTYSYFIISSEDGITKSHLEFDFVKVGTDSYTLLMFVGGSLYQMVPGFPTSYIEDFLNYFKVRANSRQWIDGVQIIKGALHTTAFTAPSEPYTIDDIEELYQNSDFSSIYSTNTITITNNDNIDDGDTLTIYLGANPIIFTYRNYFTGYGNEIIIGLDANVTAANTASALNRFWGAVFSSTAANNVVTTIAYTDLTETKSTTSDGITVTDGIQTIINYAIEKNGKIPLMLLSGFGMDSASSGNRGESHIPLLTLVAKGSPIAAGVNDSSPGADKVSLLLCGNSGITSIAEMIIADGTYDEIALQAVRFVSSYIAYQSDIGDTWNNPVYTLENRYGDCEDGSILVYSLIRNMGVPYTNIRLYIGEDYGVGHAWVAYRRDSDSQWVYLDWTLGSAYWLSITSVDSLTAMYNVIQAQYDLGEGFGEASDAHPYGSATSYINCAQVVSLFGYGYLDSLYSDEQHSTLSKELWPLSFISVESNIGATLDAELFGEVYSGIYSTASSSTDGKIALDKDIPRITVSSSSHQEYYSVLNKNIPSVELSASSYQESASTVDEAILPIRISAVCYGDTYCTVDESIGAITIVSSIIVTGTCTLNESIPAIHISARMQTLATDTFALCLNTKNNGLSKYTSYNYNSVCMFNGKMIGAKATGVYELEGNTDDGTAISWKLRTPQIRLEDQKLREIYLHGKITGDIKTIVEEPDSTRYEYDIELYSDYVDRVRTKVGKNFRPPYVIVEFMNESDQRCVIDEIRGEGMKT